MSNETGPLAWDLPGAAGSGGHIGLALGMEQPGPVTALEEVCWGRLGQGTCSKPRSRLRKGLLLAPLGSRADPGAASAPTSSVQVLSALSVTGKNCSGSPIGSRCRYPLALAELGSGPDPTGPGGGRQSH